MKSIQHRDVTEICDDLCLATISSGSSGESITLADIFTTVGARRGRPIESRATDFAGTEVFGLWLALPHADLVLYEQSTSVAHQAHIVLHELGHIVLEHRLSPPTSGARSFEGEQCRLILRQELLEPLEIQAETFAHVLAQRMRMQSPRPSAGRSHPAARRISDTLTGGRLFDRL